jgi:sulfonate transport system substrate-binding protein
MKARWLAAVATLTAVIAATIPSQAEPLKIRMGYGEVPGVISPLLFENKPILKNYGKSYTLDSTYFQATSIALQAMAAKELDISYIAFSSLSIAILNGGVDLKVISELGAWGSKGHQGPEFIVLDDGPIKSIADLKGKVIAVSARGSGFHYAMLANLKKAGLEDKRDFTIVEARLPAMEAMLREKKVDMVIGTIPFLAQMRAKGNVRTLFKPEDAMGDVQSLLNVARTEFLAQHRAEVTDFLEDYLIGLRWFLDPKNQKEASAITGTFLKRPATAFEGWAFTKEDFYRDPTATPDLVALQRNLDTVHDLGVVKQKIDIKPYVDLSYLDAAKKRLGLQ